MAAVPEVGEAHDRFASHAQHLGQHLLGMAHRLQGEGHHDVVEEAVLEAGKSRLQVDLDDVDAIPDAGEDIVRVVVHTVAAHALFVLQVAQEAAIAATQVEHLLARPDPVGDDIEVEASLNVRHVRIPSK